jgi:RNA polymerase sigma-70 factor (ECF subfamily)
MGENGQHDRLLIDRAIGGDKSAFDSLIAKHQERAYLYAFRLTRNSVEAEDIVSESFVRAHRALHNFKGKSSFSTWLYTILTNCYYDAEKKKKNRRQVSLDEPYTDSQQQTVERQFVDPSAGPQDDLDQRIVSEILVTAISKLPEAQ